MQSYPTPEVGITAGLVIIPLDTPAETAKNLDLGMKMAQQKLIQNGDQLDITPFDTGWELYISKKLQTQQHSSP